jgi:hypothetical protein
MSFFQNGEQEGKTGPVWGVGTSGRERMQGKGEGGEYGETTMYSCMKTEK